MRICIVIGFFDTFSGYQETLLADGLTAVGCDVSVICGTEVHPSFADSVLRVMGRERVYADGSIGHHGYRITRLPTRFRKGILVVLRGLLSELRKLDPDVVLDHGPGQLAGLPAIWYRRRGRRVRRIVFFQDNRAQYANLSPMMARLKRGVFYLTKGVVYAILSFRADILFANTRNAMKIVRPVIWGKPCELLPLCFDSRVFFFDTELRGTFRQRLGLSDESFLVIFTGKIDEVKRLDILLSAFRAVVGRSPSARLMIIGMTDSPVCQRVRELVHKDPTLRGYVILRDFMSQQDINGYLNAADLGVWHRQPAISIQQALGTGLFCVLPHHDMGDHLLTERTGTYFSENDYESMARIMGEMALRSPVAIMVDRSRRAEANLVFSHEVVVQTLLHRIKALS